MNLDLLPSLKSSLDPAITSLIRLSDQNSGSHNLEGLAATSDMLADLFTPLGTVRLLPVGPEVLVDDFGVDLRRPLGNVIEVTSAHQSGPEILLVSHYDTVFSPAHPFQKAVRDGDVLVGPGVADAKGGIVVLWMALSALAQAGADTRWRLLIVSDEEIGSPGSSPLLRDAAKRAEAGFGFEPSLPDGKMAGARPGSGTFTVAVQGRAAHAGRALSSGRNAVLAAGELMRSVAAMNDHDGVLANPAYLRGGGPTNIVPDFALVRFNVRPTTPEARDWAQRQIDAAVEGINRQEGYSATLTGAFGRAPKPMTPEYLRLLERVTELGHDVGLSLGFEDTGGVCDGNVMAEAGLTNVDNLGPVGGHLHASGEFVLLNTFVERAHLAAAIIIDASEPERRDEH
jgi:glutamate carboxypeptidase